MKRISKITALLLAMTICLTTLLPNLTVNIFADNTDNGTRAYEIKWVLNSDGVLTISGSGNIPDYNIDYNEWRTSAPWGEYSKSIKSVVIEDGITGIGDDAFYYCESLASVTLPNTLTNIGQNTFGYCSSITSISIPNSVTKINCNSFWRCSSLMSINVGESNAKYKSVNGVLFTKDGTELVCYPAGKADTSYIIPGDVTAVGDNAFDSCRNLTSITIPDSVTSIGLGAFAGCSSLTNVTIPPSVTYIGFLAFNDCSSLTGITIKNKYAEIGSSAIPTTTKICGYENSTAKAYANENGNKFESIGEAPATYIVSYDANGGQGTPSDQYKIHDIDLAITSYKPSRIGYKFIGWSTEKDATEAEYVAGSLYKDNAALTLYAVWKTNDSISNTDTVITASDEWVSENSWDYMYNAFYDDSYRQIVNEIMAGIRNLQTEIEVSPLIPADQVNDFCTMIVNNLAVKDCYVLHTNEYSIYDGGEYDGYLKSVFVEYCVDTKEEADRMVNELESAAADVLKGIKSSMSDYEKILYLHDWIVRKNTPDANNYANSDGGKWAYSAYGAIVDGESVCSGYVKGLLYLLGQAGFDVTFAEGVGSSQNHIWLKVKCGDDWYNIDPTWDDPCGTTQDDDPNYVCYEYFMVTDEFIKNTRSSVFDIRFFDEPSCTATKYNWYVVNDCYATSLSEADSMLKSQLKKAAATGTKYAYARIRLSSESLYNEFKGKYTASKTTAILSGITSKYSAVKRVPSSKTLSLTYRLTRNNDAVDSIGDFTGDGNVTLEDAIYLLYHTFNPTGYPLGQSGDFTGDGNVTLEDAIYLLYHTFNPTGYPLSKN